MQSARRVLVCVHSMWSPPHTAAAHTSLPTIVSTTYGGVGWRARPPHHPTLPAVCKHCGRGDGDYWGLHLVPSGWVHTLLAARGRSPSELLPVMVPAPVGLLCRPSWCPNPLVATEHVGSFEAASPLTSRPLLALLGRVVAAPSSI